MFHSSEVSVCDVACSLDSRTVSVATRSSLGAAGAKKKAQKAVETMISEVETVKNTSPYKKSGAENFQDFDQYYDLKDL